MVYSVIFTDKFLKMPLKSNDYPGIIREFSACFEQRIFQIIVDYTINLS